MKNMLVSACLLGVSCRYDGLSKPHPDVLRLIKTCCLIPVCPEIFGGLPTPRTPAEIRGLRVVTGSGGDVTENYLRGAAETLRLAKLFKCDTAVLKKRSPSCARGEIYDGTFSGKLIPGNGITADLLLKNGLTVISEDEIDEYLSLRRVE